MNRSPSIAAFLAGCGLVVATQAAYLSVRNGDPTALLQVGPGSPAKGVIERDLGPVYLAPTLGHDGKYFYLMARHPWFPSADPDTLDGLQDPRYRYGRPLYPLVAGLGGTLSPRATLAGLIVVQIVAGGVALAALVCLTRAHHLAAGAVPVGAMNPAVYSSAVLLTSDLPALALVLTGLSAWQRGRRSAAVVLFSAAVLAKEYYALAPFAVAGSLAVRRQWRIAGAVAVLPVLPLLAWKVGVLGGIGAGQGGENFTWPGRGIYETAGSWNDSWPLGALAVGLVAMALAGVRWSRAPMLRWQCSLWGLLALTGSRLVWTDPADLLRVVAPLWWFVLAAWWPTTAVDRRPDKVV